MGEQTPFQFRKRKVSQSVEFFFPLCPFKSPEEISTKPDVKDRKYPILLRVMMIAMKMMTHGSMPGLHHQQ